MFRKLGSRVIHRCRLQICKQISQIDNNLFVSWCTIINWLINKFINILTPQGNTKNSKNSSKVTANISNFTYSAITTGVLDPN